MKENRAQQRGSGHRSVRRRTALIGVIVTAMAVPAVPAMVSAAPTITTGGPFTYVEQDPPLTIGTGTTVSGDNFYDGRYIDFDVTGSTADEQLGLV